LEPLPAKRALAVNTLHADNPPLPSAATAAESPAAPAVTTEKPRTRRPRTGLGLWWQAWLEEAQSLSWLTSAILHASIILLLSALMLTDRGQGPDLWLEGTFRPDPGDSLELDEATLDAAGGDFSVPQEPPSLIPTLGSSLSETLSDSMAAQAMPIEQTPLGTISAADLVGNLMASRGGGLDGRDLASRRRLALGGGGSEASESAVELGLQWLAAHQWPDGGWRFNLESNPRCGGMCRDSGFVESTTASTGLALLCFLGAGYTQHEGPYQGVVSQGLYYLVDHMIITSQGGDLRGLTMLDQMGEGSPRIRKSGDMYCHGIATLALCEAYAMTRDQNLEQPAQLAVDFIVHAQHEKGGWRYEPKEPGDTTVSGWQVAALKSGLLGDLHIPRDVWYRAAEFFDSVEDDRGASYGYQTPTTKRISTTAVGLLCRMMLGWPKDYSPLRRGVARLADENPLQHNMYFNYYATQVLHHLGGSGWKRWNLRMRDHLVETQAAEGHERGSWFYREAWSDRGGRLYTTTLAILTLEVYYRYLPMYHNAFVDQAP
jgi:hypothetical protein